MSTAAVILLKITTRRALRANDFLFIDLKFFFVKFKNALRKRCLLVLLFHSFSVQSDAIIYLWLDQ